MRRTLSLAYFLCLSFGLSALLLQSCNRKSTSRHEPKSMVFDSTILMVKHFVVENSDTRLGFASKAEADSATIDTAGYAAIYLFMNLGAFGAAAFLHAELFSAERTAPFEFVTADRSIPATSHRDGRTYIAEMDQGAALLGNPIPQGESETFLKALNLSSSDLAPGLPWRGCPRVCLLPPGV